VVVAAAVGQETNNLPATITVDGHTYSNVTWGAVTPATVSIIHTTGTATVPLEKLPVELQSRFGYDEAKCKAYRETQMVADIHQAEQSRLQTLRGKDLRRVGDKLYDFGALRRLIAQKAEGNRKLTDFVGQADFEDQLNHMLRIDALLGRSSEYCVLGLVSTVRGDSLVVFDNLLGDYVIMMNYPGARSLFAGYAIATPALWRDTRDGSRLYDCGTVPTDDELLNLPVARVDVK
jgi:hypothetical protein